MQADRKIPPLDESSSRQIWVGWGAGVVCTALAFLVGGVFAPYLLLFAGATMAIRGHLPRLFAKHIDAQIIAGTAYRREESPEAWGVAIIACIVLASASTWMHLKIAPQKPDLARTILDAIVKMREQEHQAPPESAKVSEEYKSEPSKAFAKCSLPPNQSSCGLKCIISNPEGMAMRDTSVGFVGYLPVGTQLVAAPDLRFKLEKSATLPIPDKDGNVDSDARAFTIQAPLIPAKTDVTFELSTTDRNNLRACEQLIGVHQRGRKLIADYYPLIKKRAAAQVLPDLDTVYRAITKNSSLYKPDFMIFDQGRTKVQLVTVAEADAALALGRIAQQFSDIFATERRDNEAAKKFASCQAPVFTVEQNGGTQTTFSILPAYVDTYVYYPPDQIGKPLIPPDHYVPCTH